MKWRDDSGNAMLEFTFLGVLLLVPLVYAVVTALTVEKAAYAVTAASREAGRVYVSAGADDTAYGRAFAAAQVVMRDQGLDLADGELEISCEYDPCSTAGGLVHVRIDRSVDLPLVPALGSTTPSIAVHGRHDEVVSCFLVGAAQAPPGETRCP